MSNLKKVTTFQPIKFEKSLIIPQGTFVNKRGPDHIAGPKALDANYCRQPTL